MEGMLDSPDGHSDPVGRRDFLYAALAASALAAMPRQALAQPAPKPPRLTVFALDIYTGLPAAGLRVDFSVLEGEQYRLVKTVNINSTGNVDEPVLTAEKMAVGSYEFLLYVAEYFTKLGVKLPDPPFLNKVPIRFSIFDAKQVFHVPVLLTPWCYTTYRGS